MLIVWHVEVGLRCSTSTIISLHLPHIEGNLQELVQGGGLVDGGGQLRHLGRTRAYPLKIHSLLLFLLYCMHVVIESCLGQLRHLIL